MFEAVETIFHTIVQYGVLFMEAVGVMVILATGVQSLIMVFRKDESIRLTLAKGIALALEFKLGGEVLRTVLVTDWKDLLIIGAIMAIRIIMTLTIHWEINEEEHKLKGK